MYVAIIAALIAGLFFAIGGVLQQRVASTRPEGESLSPRLIWDLLHQRLWVAGISCAVLSYVFQALALNFAPLAVVQPIIVSELLFAIPISLRLHKMRLRRRDWIGVLAVAVGIAAAIAAAAPTQGNPIQPIGQWTPVLAAIAILVAGALLIQRRISGPMRASLIALAAAATMGTESGLMAAATNKFSKGAISGFESWEIYAMTLTSIFGLLLIQSAFQAGPLASSMPVVDAAEPLVAIGIGLALFGESIRTAPLALGVAIAGIAAMIAGIVLLDTSPVVQALHEQEKEEAEHTGHGETVSLGADAEAASSA
ncbi:MAG TPA: DMT family transporter [Mycobacteriales bacterium]|nr:DMT family transporter [Mycobacteriales bacterium]